MTREGAVVIPLDPNDIHFSPLSTSLHPHLEIHFNTSTPGPCAVHLHLSLPDSIFVDRDELLDLWASVPIQWDLSPKDIDIERPVPGPGTELGLILPLDHGKASTDIPLHARYLAPREQGYETIRLGDMKGGIVCSSEHVSLDDLPEIPFPLTLTLPTGKMSHQPYVELGTTAAIWLGFAWLAYKIIRLGRRHAGAKVKMS